MKFANYKIHSVFDAYLTGLWEGDGHITRKENTRPSFQITFHIKNEALALKCAKILGGRGAICSIQYRHNKNACVLHIRGDQGIRVMIDLMNGNLRTPKHSRVKTVVDWYNKKTQKSITLLPVSRSPVGNSAWFAGFIDADGNFLVRVDKRPRARSVACRFLIAQRMVDQQTGMSYRDVCFQIAQFLHVKLNIHRVTAIKKAYFVIAMTSKKSKTTLRHYMSCYPLLGSKMLDYQDWCAVDDLMSQGNIDLLKVSEYKQAMNKSRTSFSWDHLDTF